jgi:ribosomal protein L30
MVLNKNLDKMITITQVKSDNKLIKRLKSTLIGLGLRGSNTKSTVRKTKSVIGMIVKVNHLVKVTENI